MNNLSLSQFHLCPKKTGTKTIIPFFNNYCSNNIHQVATGFTFNIVDLKPCPSSIKSTISLCPSSIHVLKKQGQKTIIPFSCLSDYFHVYLIIFMFVFQNNFDIDEGSRKQTLRSIGNKWKNFKAYLYKTYIKPIKEAAAAKNDPKPIFKPPAEYPYLTPDIWQPFVSQRNGKRWEEKSKHGKRIRKLNLYPHHLSRKGYAGLTLELVCFKFLVLGYLKKQLIVDF